jgi:hypothetical protein
MQGTENFIEKGRVLRRTVERYIFQLSLLRETGGQYRKFVCSRDFFTIQNIPPLMLRWPPIWVSDVIIHTKGGNAS